MVQPLLIADCLRSAIDAWLSHGDFNMFPIHTPFPVRLPTLLLLLSASTIPAAAQAWSYGGYGYPYYGHSRHYSHGHNYGHRPYRSRHQYGSSRQSRRHGYDGDDCHPTSKSGYHDGYEGRVGGTMCYDDYGDAYIVPGSRYLIERY